MPKTILLHETAVDVTGRATGLYANKEISLFFIQHYVFMRQVNGDEHKGFWMECLSDLIDAKIKCISNIEGDVDKAKYSDNGKL